ncbi:MAG: hypothetical protein QOE70_3399 [Chthoniobacter sp.]|nr:hypothetical protein [Chthoniobacter sp.]
MLLKDPRANQAALHHWVTALADQCRSTNRVPVETILRWMENWHSNLTVKSILQLGDG